MINESAKLQLINSTSVRIAHLVEIELAGTDGVYSYLTDYSSNISLGGKIYLAGKVTNVGSTTRTQGITNYTLSVTVAGEFQEEIDKATTELSYEGRAINVYRAYILPSGNILNLETSTGGPLILFEGKVSGISLRDNVTSGSSTVTWSCAGLLYDFEKVNGRLLDDAAHRGLVSGGIGELPVPSSGAKRVEYRTDTGLLHTNQTISTNIKYLAKEKEYYLKKSWGGLKSSLREREVEVERELELNTSLEALYLPVVYGVRKVPGIPVFLDVLKNDPSTMYVIYAVCEGEISGFLNVYVDGVSSICEPGISSSDGVCMGNLASGDTLSMYTVSSRSGERQNNWRSYKYDRDGQAFDYNLPGTIPATDSTVGTTHGDTINIAAEGGAITMQFFHGKGDQSPCSELVGIAASNNFLVQNNTKDDSGSNWGSNYWAGASTGVSGAALLDIAYVVCKFKISDDRTSLPNIEFVVLGKKVPVYSTPSTYTLENTLNPTWHMLDYLTSSIYGGGLTINDIDIPSFIDSANKLNTIDTSYSPEFVKMWRYVGWSSPTQPTAIMQCNTLINTEGTITKNVETILEQFGGSLVPVAGKYHLSVEDDSSPVANITIGDLIGPANLTSQANKDKWNSMQATIQDPALNWGGSQISFFNSTFLAEDNGIKKNGRAVFEHVTNYYTARSWAEYLLDKSRFSKKISITTYFKYFYLKPNDIVTFTYDRFNYANTKFRVVEVEESSDGLISLVLERYSTSVYTRSPQSPIEVPQGPGSLVAAPANLGFSLLPNPSINVNVPEGITYGILYWDVGASDILRYDVVVSDSPVIYQVPPTSTTVIRGKERVYALIPGIASNTQYVLKVQAINKYGIKSAYNFLGYTTSPNLPPSNLPRVQNFSLVTPELDGSFTGGDLSVQWDLLSVPGGAYEIEILNNLGIELLNTTLPITQSSYIFTLEDNILSHLANAGTTGAYRYLLPRIRLKIDSLYSEWSYLP